MMKSTLTFLTVLFFFVVNVFAQETTNESVDIRAMLDKQITEIKNKQAENKTEAPVETKVETKQAGAVTLSNVTVNEKVEEFLTKGLEIKIFVTIEILMLSGLIFLWATKSKREKRRKIAILKNNIKKLREERIGSFNQDKLSMLRGKLRYDPIKINDNGKDITFRAKKNNIGKGEVHLAAKIKLLIGEYK